MKSPASPGLSLVTSSTSHSSVPALRPTGSVKRDKPSVPVPVTRIPMKPRRYSEPVPIETSSYPVGSQHAVYQIFQRDKLLMGGEVELSQLNVTMVFIMILLGFILTWHMFVIAVLLGWPGQRMLRAFAEEDPDYWKVYLDALSTPHIREPE